MIILDQLNCLASLADIFDFSQLEKNSSWYVVALFNVYDSGLTIECHAVISYSSVLPINKRGKVPKKLWCCVGGEHYKLIWFYQLGCRECELTIVKRFDFTVANSHYQTS